MESPRILGFLVVLAVSVTASGCWAGYGSVHDPRRVARYERHLVRIAARDTGCSAGSVTGARIGELLWVANTCVGPREYFLRCNRRCRWEPIATVSQAAAIPLSCPAASIVEQPTGAPYTRIADGCGRQVQLSFRCASNACAWAPDGPATAYSASPPVMVVPAPSPIAQGSTPPVILVPGPNPSAGGSAPPLMAPAPGPSAQGSTPPVIVVPGPSASADGSTPPVIAPSPSAVGSSAPASQPPAPLLTVTLSTPG